MKTTSNIISLRMELLTKVRNDYRSKGYQLSDTMLANTLKYVHTMLLPAYKNAKFRD